MRFAAKLALCAVLAASAGPASPVVAAARLTVGVSWPDLREDRWKSGEAAIRKALDEAGATYVGADAQTSAVKQSADVDDLMRKGANVLIIAAVDPDAILAAVKKASDLGVPVLAYDRLIESPKALYVAFDEAAAGRMMAKAVEAAKPSGVYAFIKGDKADPVVEILSAGVREALKPAMNVGRIKDAGQSYTDGWRPDAARDAVAGILAKASNRIDAVVTDSDGLAGGAIAALAEQGMAGSTPVAGRGGDHAALNRVALGTQIVSVWEDPRDLGAGAAQAAVALGAGKKAETLPNVRPFAGGKSHVRVNAILLDPLPVARDNLGIILDRGWMTRAQLCAGVRPGAVKVCG